MSGLLDQARAGIDLVDGELVELLARRVRLARLAGFAKRAAGLPVVDAAREQAVVNRARGVSILCGIDEAGVEAVVRAVIDLCRTEQGAGGLPRTTAEGTRPMDGQQGGAAVRWLTLRRRCECSRALALKVDPFLRDLCMALPAAQSVASYECRDRRCGRRVVLTAGDIQEAE